MITKDISKEYRIQDAISRGTRNSLILDNINEYIDFDGFKIPVNCILSDKYRGIILENCIKIKLSDELLNIYRYRPKYLSLKLYGYTDLWHLILWINDMTTVTQFDKRIIYVYDPDAINILDKLISMEKDRLDENKYNTPVIVPTDESITTRR